MNKKKSVNNTRNVVAPVIVNIDALAYASDQEIDSRKDQLQSERHQALNSGYDPYLWEVELAYVDRELQIRETRRLAHESYVKNNPDVVDAYSFDFADNSISDLN